MGLRLRLVGLVVFGQLDTRLVGGAKGEGLHGAAGIINGHYTVVVEQHALVKRSCTVPSDVPGFWVGICGGVARSQKNCE